MGRTRTPWVVVAALSAAACASRAPATVAIAGPPAAAAPIAPSAPHPSAAIDTPALPPLGESDEDEGSPGIEDGTPGGGEGGWLGVELEPAAPDEGGVRIARVVPKSPAEHAGLAPGDLILRLDSEPVAAPADVVSVVSRRAAGTRVGVALKRKSADKLVAGTPGAFPGPGGVYPMTFFRQPPPPSQRLLTAHGSFG